MRLSPLVSASSLLSRQSSIDYNAAPPNLSTLANASLFDTWRPRAHVLPAFGSIGDPCMHYTDPQTGLFHVGWLANGAAGATTDDLVTYTDLNPDSAPFIQPGGINDPIAVFDGSVMPIGINGTPTLLYTSVSYLPIQWTVAYTKGSETQSLAVATDGGRNLTKLAHGPVIPSPPFAVNVTGFRDPYVFQSPQFDNLLNSTNGTWYTTVSGGAHGDGPILFLYRQYESDPNFETWEYLGEWFHEPANSTWSDAGWAGRWGFNFEVGNMFSLSSSGYDPSGELFATQGAEWSLEPIVPQVSDFREMLWVSGNQSIVNGSLQFHPTMAGRLDAGRSAYAAAGKILPATSQASLKSGTDVDRFISYLWLTNDFYGTLDFPTQQQNWSGSLLLPRELSLGYVENVVDNELARERGSWRIDSEDNEAGTVKLATLHQGIAREPMAAFKTNATNVITQQGANLSSSTPFIYSPKSTHYVLCASIIFPSSARNKSNLKAGFSILSGAHEHTDVYYQFSNESLIIDRSNSSAAAATTPGIDTRNEAGKFRLFDIVEDEKQDIESLDLTIVVDGGIVEVHANDRFALSTWAWAWFADSRNVTFLAEGGEVQFSNVAIWEGLVDVWPARAD